MKVHMVLVKWGVFLNTEILFGILFKGSLSVAKSVVILVLFVLKVVYISLEA
jgi:hypothetical protein